MAVTFMLCSSSDLNFECSFLSSLSSKDDILVYRDMLSISTLDINFRILPNLSVYA